MATAAATAASATAASPTATTASALPGSETKKDTIDSKIPPVSVGRISAGKENIIAAGVNNTIMQNSNNINITVNLTAPTIRPFTPGAEIFIPVACLSAALMRTPELQLYFGWPLEARTSETSKPVVVEAFMAIIQTAHDDLTQRNIYMDDKRKNLVEIFTKEGQWRSLTLLASIGCLLATIQRQLQSFCSSASWDRPTEADQKENDMKVRDVIGSILLLYECDPEYVSEKICKPFKEHLQTLQRPAGKAVAVPNLVATKNKPPAHLVPKKVQKLAETAPVLCPIPVDNSRPPISAIVDRIFMVSFGDLKPITEERWRLFVRRIAAEAKMELDLDLLSEIGNRVYGLTEEAPYGARPRSAKEMTRARELCTFFKTGNSLEKELAEKMDAEAAAKAAERASEEDLLRSLGLLE